AFPAFLQRGGGDSPLLLRAALPYSIMKPVQSQWDARMEKNRKKGTQHAPGHFDIALELACYVAEI
ncbi:MAG: hypothetical protein MR374_08760, partial [Clostridia bacterium]|nr:hypothetical protein [Clostridia bacterium]